MPRPQAGTHGGHSEPIFDNVLDEQDACLGVAEQSRQGRLAVKERTPTQVLAIELNWVESPGLTHEFG